MSTEKDLDLYLNAVIKEGLFSNKGNLQFCLNNLFQGVNFKNKCVLDIGGGSGIYFYYAACMGAKSVVCLEPEATGSSKEVEDSFHKLNEILEYDNIARKTIAIQEYESEGKTYDIIFLYNSINHLDETACVDL